jgi:hypothetical protein
VLPRVKHLISENTLHLQWCDVFADNVVALWIEVFGEQFVDFISEVIELLELMEKVSDHL